MKYILSLIVVFFIATSACADELLDEGFEGSFPPAGWTVERTNMGYYFNYHYSWNQMSDYAHSGTYSALAYGAWDYTGQDELLYTGELDLTGYTGASVTFWTNGLDYGYSDGGNTFTLEVSTDVMKTWTTLWTYPAYNVSWEEHIVDLTAYTGNTIRLGWRHVFIPNGYAVSNDEAIDDVLVEATMDDDDDDDDDNDDNDDDNDNDDNDDDNDNDDSTEDDDVTDDDDSSTDDDDDEENSCCG